MFLIPISVNNSSAAMSRITSIQLIVAYMSKRLTLPLPLLPSCFAITAISTAMEPQMYACNDAASALALRITRPNVL